MHNGNGIDLTIEDDGKGFNLSSINNDGHGLGITTMKERAALINGICEIDSTPGRGTRIHVWVRYRYPAPTIRVLICRRH